MHRIQEYHNPKHMFESEEMLCPLTHKKLHFVTQSSYIENSTQS